MVSNTKEVEALDFDVMRSAEEERKCLQSEVALCGICEKDAR
jgi:hypothetical protein